jgi:hypothetical protein
VGGKRFYLAATPAAPGAPRPEEYWSARYAASNLSDIEICRSAESELGCATANGGAVLTRVMRWWISSLGLSLLFAVTFTVILDNSRWWNEEEVLLLWLVAAATIAVPAFVGFGVCVLMREGSIDTQHISMSVVRVVLSLAAALVVGYFIKDMAYDEWQVPIVMGVSFVCLWLSIGLPLVLIPALRQSCDAPKSIQRHRRFKRVLILVSLSYVALWLITVQFGRPAIRRMIMHEYEVIGGRFELEEGIEWSVFSAALGHPDTRSDRFHIVFSKGLVIVPFVVVVDDMVTSCPIGSARWVHLWFFGLTRGRPISVYSPLMTCAA